MPSLVTVVTLFLLVAYTGDKQPLFYKQQHNILIIYTVFCVFCVCLFFETLNISRISNPAASACFHVASSC